MAKLGWKIYESMGICLINDYALSKIELSSLGREPKVELEIGEKLETKYIDTSPYSIKKYIHELFDVPFSAEMRERFWFWESKDEDEWCNKLEKLLWPDEEG